MASLVGKGLIGDLGKGERTVQEWQSKFLENKGCFPESLQGVYQRQGVMWQSEELNTKARKYVREYCSKRKAQLDYWFCR